MNASRSSFGKAKPHIARSDGQGAVTRIAAVQLASGPNVKGNLQEAGRLIEMAAAHGAKLVALPEYFAIMGMRDQDKVKAREKPGEGPIQEFLSLAAKRHGIWLVGGSVPLATSNPDKVRNSCLVYDDRGKLVAVRAAVAERARREQQHQGPQALAPASDDVFRDLADQDDAGAEPGADDLVHGAHVRRRELAYGFQRHYRALRKRG